MRFLVSLGEVAAKKLKWCQNTELVFASRGDDMGKIDAQGNVSVQAIHFAEAIPESVNLLKIDIEGAEFAVLERLIQAGAINRVKNIVAELHPSKSTKDRMLGIMKFLPMVGLI